MFKPRAWTAIFVAAGIIVLAGCSGGDQTKAASDASAAKAGQSSSKTSSGGAKPTAVDCVYDKSGSPAKKNEPPSGKQVSAVGMANFTLKMTEGNVVLKLDRSKAPCTVNSFESLAKQGYFNNTVCHRLVDKGIFILQCGDPSASGSGGPGYRFGDELSGAEKYPAGTVAMANAGPNTNGSQFFLVFADTPLPANYTVFGTMDAASTKIISDIGAKGVDASRAPAPVSPAKINEVVAC